jgi:hypothetical protein
MAKVKIELIDHTGETPSGKTVSHDQYIVKADGVHVGYCGKKDNPWVSYIVFLDEEAAAEVTAAIGKKLKAEVNEPTMVVDPAEHAADDEGDEDE